MTSKKQKEAWIFLWTEAGRLWKNYIDEINDARQQASERKLKAGEILNKRLHELKMDFYKQYIED